MAAVETKRAHKIATQKILKAARELDDALKPFEVVE